MIRNSFIFLERINHASEQNIWSQGITDWDSFRDAGHVRGISPRRKTYYDRQLIRAENALGDRDTSFFARSLPHSEVWRIYDLFRDDCAFLDIETSGCYSDITVVGIYDGEDMITMVKGCGLSKENLKAALNKYKMLVSFNGLSFDVPVINRCFSRVVPDIPHLDLRHPLARLGFTGGLKKIEKDFGIRRDSALEGDDAVMLWNRYACMGDEESLGFLVEYNADDAMNLRPLADQVFCSLERKMKERILVGV